MIHSQSTLPTLIELLQRRASQQPEQKAYTFLFDDGEEQSVSYAELDCQARALAAWLQSQQATGERALLLYQPGLDYIAAFFGCLYAGVVPVPAYPPRLNGNLGRLEAIVRDAEAQFALTTQAIYSGIERRMADVGWLGELHWLVSEGALGDEWAERWQNPHVRSEDLAFLQYTSGSTSIPKGVMLSHGNLLNNLQLIEESFGTSPEDRGVVWLPPYHDMGLIGGILQPLYTGYHMTLMAPVDFIQKPLRWLETISRVQATVSGGPNFAYELCLQKVTAEQRERLDLRAWNIAFTGAEPIRGETLERFAAFFGECGFREQAFYPCYGLAEGTLFVTGGRQEEAPIVRAFHGESLKQNRAVEVTAAGEGDRTLVSSGRIALMKQQVAVVHTETLVGCEEGQVGEIWVSGDSVAQGYWRRAEQSAETFGAYRADTGDGPFLRTGDLGFVQDGELYVTGRLKDLIIIRGRNYYPQDIEFTVQESHPAVRNSNGAAVVVEINGEERLVVVQEIERAHRKANLDEVVRAVRQAVSEEHQLQLFAVVMIKPASIPKTSSGKIQRHACRDRFLAGTLETVLVSRLDGMQAHASGDLQMAQSVQAEGEATVAQGGADQSVVNKSVGLGAVAGFDIAVLGRELLLQMEPEQRRLTLESFLCAKAAAALRISVSQVDKQQSLNTLGLDSLMAVDLKNEVEESLGVELPLTALLDGPSIADLAGQVLHMLGNGVELAESQPVFDGSDAEFALSHGQRALWFMQKLNADNPIYHLSRAVRVSGRLDTAMLQMAFARLLRRHPLLRAVVSLQEPIQRVQELIGLPFAIVQADGWSDEQLQADVQAAATRPFGEEALVRMQVWTRAEDESVLLLSMHHLIVDFWSIGVMMQELWTVYEALQAGHDVEPAQVAAPVGTYAEYVFEHERLVESEKGERLLAYWQQQLAGAQTLLNLPSDRPRPAVQSYRGALRTFHMSEELTERVKALATRQGVTLYVLLMAAYQLLLHRYSGQDDIVVGSPIAGRTAAKYAEVVGYFVNLVPVRGQFAERMTFAEFLQQMRGTVLGALDHQHYPFSLLVDRLQPLRDPSYSPLFQVMFTFQRSHLPDIQDLTGLALGVAGANMKTAGLAMELYPVEQTTAQMDLWLTMGEVEGRLAGSFEYNTDLFDAQTIDRLVMHFETLLQSISNDASEVIAELPLLTKAEREQILLQWNETAAEYEAGACIHHLFEQQVEKTPDQVAVVFEDRSLTYRELNERANRLALVLQRQGVGSNVMVGIFMKRSLELMVGLLGILKAGGAYVPIDPTYPEERLAFILEDTEAKVLVTQPHLVASLPKHQADVVVVDQEDGQIAMESTVNPNAAVNVDHLAYVIYTSGSTGKPKGVLVEHRNAVNLFAGMDQKIGHQEGDAMLAVSSICFDISVVELFWTLVRGKKVVLLSEHETSGGLVRAESVHRTGDFSLHAQARLHQATLLQCTPALMKILSSDPRNVEALQQLRMCVLCGEALPVTLAEQLKRELPKTVLFNMYGPTEATVYATTHEVVELANSVPIGRPIANMQTYILDRHLQPVPVGVQGELHIGGLGLARGYHKRPELTAERFVAHPFAADEGARLYKTGDLAAYAPDGTIRFYGRIDHQVKMRGFRIELGEIEESLRTHPTVSAAVVIDREDVPGDKYLAAYLVPVAEQTPTVQELRAFLQETLPDYMVPSAFMTLKQIPLMPNGKVDRKALPNPKEYRQQMETVYVAPQNELERAISAIWQDVLHVEKVGIHDNFFEIGGHSLQIVQVHGKLKTALGVDMPIAQLYQFPTVSSLAKHLDQGLTETIQAGSGRDRAENRRELMSQRRQNRGSRRR